MIKRTARYEEELVRYESAEGDNIRVIVGTFCTRIDTSKVAYFKYAIRVFVNSELSEEYDLSRHVDMAPIQNELESLADSQAEADEVNQFLLERLGA